MLHVIIFVSSYYTVHLSSGLLLNWKNETVVEAVESLANFIVNNQFEIELALTFVLFAFASLTFLLFKYIRVARLAQVSGIFYANKHNSWLAKRKSDNFLKAISLKSEDVWSLGATGWETFVRGPLNKSFFSTAQCLRVSLLNPMSAQVVRNRSKDCSMQSDNYFAEIYASIIFCHLLIEKKIVIELKLYSEYPFWKLIVVKPSCVWIQQYPKRGHVRNTISIAFNSDGGNNGVYGHYYGLFERLWNSQNFVSYDFPTGSPRAETLEDFWKEYLNSQNIRKKVHDLLETTDNGCRAAILNSNFYLKLNDIVQENAAKSLVQTPIAHVATPKSSPPSKKSRHKRGKHK